LKLRCAPAGKATCCDRGCRQVLRSLPCKLRSCCDRGCRIVGRDGAGCAAAALGYHAAASCKRPDTGCKLDTQLCCDWVGCHVVLVQRGCADVLFEDDLHSR
jgi:hypothetical protein